MRYEGGCENKLYCQVLGEHGMQVEEFPDEEGPHLLLGGAALRLAAEHAARRAHTAQACPAWHLIKPEGSTTLPSSFALIHNLYTRYAVDTQLPELSQAHKLWAWLCNSCGLGKRSRQRSFDLFGACWRAQEGATPHLDTLASMWLRVGAACGRRVWRTKGSVASMEVGSAPRCCLSALYLHPPLFWRVEQIGCLQTSMIVHQGRSEKDSCAVLQARDSFTHCMQAAHNGACTCGRIDVRAGAHGGSFCGSSDGHDGLVHNNVLLHNVIHDHILVAVAQGGRTAARRIHLVRQGKYGLSTY